MSEPTKSPEQGIVTGNGKKGLDLKNRLYASRRRMTMLLVAAVILATGGVFLYIQTRPYRPKTSIPQSQLDQIPANYDSMTVQEVKYRVQVDTHHTLAELQSKPINKDLLPTYSTAYAAARALCRVGSNAECLQAYALAGTMVPKGDYSFHMNYAYMSYLRGSKSVAAAQAKLAKQAVIDAGASASQRRVTTTNANGIIKASTT